MDVNLYKKLPKFASIHFTAAAHDIGVSQKEILVWEQGRIRRRLPYNQAELAILHHQKIPVIEAESGELPPEYTDSRTPYPEFLNRIIQQRLI